MPSAEITEYDVLHEFTYLSDIESQKEGDLPTNGSSDDPCSQPTRRPSEYLLLSNAYDGYKQTGDPLASEMLIDDYIMNDGFLVIPSSAGDNGLLSPLSPLSPSSSDSPFLLETPGNWGWSRTCSPTSMLSSPGSPEPSHLPLSLEERDDSTPNSPKLQETVEDSDSESGPLGVSLRLLSPQYIEASSSTDPEQTVSPKKNAGQKRNAKKLSTSVSPVKPSHHSSRSCTPPLPSVLPSTQGRSPDSDALRALDPPTETAAEFNPDCSSRGDKESESVEVINDLASALSSTQAIHEDDLGSKYWPNRPSRSSKRRIDYAEEADDDDDSDYRDDNEEEPPLSRKQCTFGRRKKASQKRPGKVFPCPAPTGKCSQTFTRRGDAERHMRNARIHADLAVQEEGAASRRCQICNADLSRSDARKRHSNAEACGKRNGSKRTEENETRRSKSRRIS